jgi:hypothetical protein
LRLPYLTAFRREWRRDADKQISGSIS